MRKALFFSLVTACALSGCMGLINAASLTRARFTLTIEGQTYTLLNGGTARIRNGILVISHGALRARTPRTVMRIRLPEQARAAGAKFGSIEIALPRLSGPSRMGLARHYQEKLKIGEPYGTVIITDRSGKSTTGWDIMHWDIERFDFPDLDAKDDEQLIQYVTIRVEKVTRK
jgi:hypothetical protein